MSSAESNGPVPVEPDAATVAESASDLEDRSIKRRALLWMVAVFLIEGISIGVLEDGDLLAKGVRVATYLAFVVLLHHWCGADARLHGRELWPHFALTLVFFPGPLLVLPVHLVRTRGPRGLLTLGLAVGFFLVLAVAEYIGIHLGVQWSDGPMEG